MWHRNRMAVDYESLLPHEDIINNIGYHGVANMTLVLEHPMLDPIMPGNIPSKSRTIGNVNCTLTDCIATWRILFDDLWG